MRKVPYVISQEQNGDILIVHGSLERGRVVKALLEEQGYRMRSARDGQSALVIAEKHPPDLILLDVTVAPINGYEICRRFKAIPEFAACPVLFLIRRGETENLAEGYAAGGVAFLTKPVQPDELLASVKTHLSLYRKHQSCQRQSGILEQRLAEQTSVLRQAQRRLQESKERFWGMVEQSPLAIEILAPTGEIQQVNPAWMRLWGFSEEEATQVLASYNMLTDEQVTDLGIAQLTKAAFAGEAVVLPPVEYDAERAMGELGLVDVEARTHWLQCHLFPVKDADGQILYIVNTYVDITELRRAEQETREHRDVVTRMNRTTSMGQLTGAIAHEVNQPLTGILSNAQAVELLLQNSHYGQGELAEIMTEIVADAKRAAQVIRNLRGLYRKQEGEFLPLELNSVVDETMQLLHSEFLLRDVRLSSACAASLPMISGNRIQLQQVLVNLIMNGHQAMRDEATAYRHIHITTSSGSNEVRAWVEDCGQGIDAYKIERIFEPLATWKPGGTGMGLAICSSIIKAHGGRMWAENRPEGGARGRLHTACVEGRSAGSRRSCVNQRSLSLMMIRLCVRGSPVFCLPLA